MKLGVALYLSVLTVNAQAPSSASWRKARLEALLQHMTLDEKLGQLNQYSAGEPTGPGTTRDSYDVMIAEGKIGSLLNVTNAKQADKYQRIAVDKSRLHIPLLFGLDVIHGFRTIFPINLGLSATWAPALIEKASRLAAEEAAAQGIRWTFSPMVDIARDARWGRISESAGEDPYLGSAIAKAYVRGYQGDRLDNPTSILACAKHFAGYGAAEGGREYNTTEISERSLRQTYLPPFHACVGAGAATLMAAFNSLNGVPATSNSFTLGEILRKEWRFNGFVVSDWDSIRETMAHGIANRPSIAAGKAFLAGLDMDMESGLYLSELPTLVQSGAVPMARINDSVRRILAAKLDLGLFENPYTQPNASIGPLPAQARQLARTLAEESFVLLKNQPYQGLPLLPLVGRSGQSIALVGALADSAQDMLGSWSAQGRTSDVTTLRAALAERAAQGKMLFRYARGVDSVGDDETGFEEALAIAKRADVVVMALGEKAQFTGEAASRAHLDLTEKQQKLLEAVVATGKPVVLVLFSGRPLTVTWAAQFVPAILEAWFPGVEAGPALVRTLFGDVNPSGHLTATFPRSVGQEPLYYNALATGRPVPAAVDLGKPPDSGSRFVSRYVDELNAPLFPFGYGLSYTTFTYSPLTLSREALSATALNSGRSSVTVRADLTNSGRRPGTEVAQCYIRLTGTSVARPVRELRGFQRVELAPGQTKHVEFTLGRDELSFWNIDMKYLAEPSFLQVWIASDSASGLPAAISITK